MADWLDVTALFLYELGKKDSALMRDIRLAIARIDKNPLLGEYLTESRRMYTDEIGGRFRIGYNYRDQGNVEVVVINIFPAVQ